MERGADYVLALKKNHKGLYEEVKDTFESAEGSAFGDLKYDFAETVGKGHGRIETRRCWAIDEPEVLGYLNESGAWPELNSVVKVSATRLVGEKETEESRYYLSSLKGNASRSLEATREHWGIENSVH